MTKQKLSLVAVLALGMGTAAMAADSLESAFKEGKVDGRIRAHYFYTDWDQNQGWDRTSSGAFTNSKSDKDSKGTAVGGSLLFKTAPLHGVSIGIGAYTTQNVGLSEKGANSTGSRTASGSYKNTTASDLFARGPGAATDFGGGYSVIAEAYVQYNVNKSDVRLGRMLMTNPFINPNDTKMIPIAIEGLSAHVAEFSDTIITVDYANKIKERGMTYFGNMADTGDTPDAIKNYYRTHYTSVDAKNTNNIYALTNTTTQGDASTTYGYGSGGDAPGVEVLGIKNQTVKDLELQAWIMHWQDIVNQYMLEANYSMNVSSLGLSFGARFMAQTDEGAGAIITPMDGSSAYSKLGVTNSAPTGSYAADINKKGDNNNKIDTNLLAVRAIAKYNETKLLLAYAKTDKSGDLLAPWRGFPTEGYTRSMTQTDWIANTKSYKTQIDYDFTKYVKGVSALLSFSYYDRDPSKLPYQGLTDRYYGNGDTKQWNMDFKYAVPEVKGLEWKLRLMKQENSVVASVAHGTGSSSGGATLSTATASEGFGNDTSNREMRIEMNYRF